MSMGKCFTCGGAVALEAKACPHCGQPARDRWGEVCDFECPFCRISVTSDCRVCRGKVKVEFRDLLYPWSDSIKIAARDQFNSRCFRFRRDRRIYLMMCAAIVVVGLGVIAILFKFGVVQ